MDRTNSLVILTNRTMEDRKMKKKIISLLISSIKMLFKFQATLVLWNVDSYLATSREIHTHNHFFKENYQNLPKQNDRSSENLI
jgi:hypothetical protein